MVGQINIWVLIFVCFFLKKNIYICFERNLISREMVIYHSKFNIPLSASKVTQLFINKVNVPRASVYEELEICSSYNKLLLVNSFFLWILFHRCSPMKTLHFGEHAFFDKPLIIRELGMFFPKAWNAVLLACCIKSPHNLMSHWHFDFITHFPN